MNENQSISFDQAYNSITISIAIAFHAYPSQHKSRVIPDKPTPHNEISRAYILFAKRANPLYIISHGRTPRNSAIFSIIHPLTFPPMDSVLSSPQDPTSPSIHLPLPMTLLTPQTPPQFSTSTLSLIFPQRSIPIPRLGPLIRIPPPPLLATHSPQCPVPSLRLLLR